MMHIVSSSIFLLLFLALPSIHASCTTSTGPCQKGEGICTASVRAAISGDIDAAVDFLSYGKFCGRFNKCQTIDEINPSIDIKDLDKDSVCPVRKRKFAKKNKKIKCSKSRRRVKKGKKEKCNEICPPKPCDKIDAACADHDSCIDKQIIINKPPKGTSLTITQRCSCDVEFVVKNAILSQTTNTTGLCDAEFYTDNISDKLPLTPIGLVQHEATLMAGGFCCNIRADLDGNGKPDCEEDDNTNKDEFKVASSFCDTFIEGLVKIGIDLCP